MTLNVSSQMRVVLIAALVVAALGLGLFAVGHARTGSAPEVKVIQPLHPVRKHVTPVPAHPKVKVKATHAAPAHAKVKHSAAPVHAKVKAAPVVHRAPKPAPKPKPVPVAAANGLPTAVANALTKHPVVVVALYQSDRNATTAERRKAQTGASPAAAAGVDRIAFAEAAAGAHKAGAGFVGIDVLSQREAAPLVQLVGVLPDPAVLVYTRPATLTVKITSFADRDTVAQAAADAVHASASK